MANMAVQRGDLCPLGTALGACSSSGEREPPELSWAGADLSCSASCAHSTARLPGSATVSDTDVLINKQQQQQ